jgi:hypothetical protein
MSRNLPLLKESTHILPPDIDLTQNISMCKQDVESLFKCEKCGRDLESPYYLLFGISPSTSIITMYECDNLDDEKQKVETVIDMIRFEGKDFAIENKYQWIFSDQNITNSRTRLCVDCHGEYKGYLELKDIHYMAIHIRVVYFAIEEYQRRHTPINSAKSDYERYLIFLPDRTMVHWIGPGTPSWGVWCDISAQYSFHVDSIAQFLIIALIPDYDLSKLGLSYASVSSMLQELRADFIQDKNRKVPNDQELTRWMKKNFSDHEDHSYIKAIDSCKIFTNPQATQIGDHDFKSKYSVIVHYIDTDWDEFNI